MSFEEGLRRGRFGIPRCTRCGRIVWPCADFCGHCLGEVRVSPPEGPVRGRVMEFSRKGDRYFCLVEIEGAIRIIASMSGEPGIGQAVTVVRCGVVGGDGGDGGSGSGGNNDGGSSGSSSRYFFHVI